MPPGGAVIDILADLGSDAAGKIGVDAGNEGGGDNGAPLQFIGRHLRHY